MNYKDFYKNIYEDCGCGDDADNRLYPEQYPYGGFDYTNRDKEEDEKMIHKVDELMAILEKNIPTNPSKWAAAKAAAKRKFKVYPSAYANLWAAKKYKGAGGGWRKGKVSERSDPVGQEDSDINNDSKVDVTDHYLNAKQNLLKKYMLARKTKQDTF
jgi:hypothetical protein